MNLVTDHWINMRSRKAMTNAERQKRYRKESPAKANANRKKYRHDNSKWETDTSYLSRPFLAWDGEGVTVDGVHKYVMLAGRHVDGSAIYIAEEQGLSTAQCFETVLKFAEKHPTAIHVIYGGGYDFNMFMRDMPRYVLEQVYKRKFYRWNNYRIGWRPGKSFYLCRVDESGEKIGKGVTIYDVVSFFQTAFVKACDDYLGDQFHEREMIVNNKALRGNFTLADVPEVKKYNDAELVNLLALMVELRERLNKVGLRPRRWDGPGAVASALLLRENVKAHLTETPDAVAKAARYAYAGGRFEVIKFGHYEQNVYEYDVNSAYPAALRHVPSLSHGTWEHRKGDPGIHEFAIYHIDSDANRDDIPAPLFRRDSNGTICYPMSVRGWYWTPERVASDLYCSEGYGVNRIIEAWVFVPDKDVSKPFHFIEPLYNKRRALKKAGDGAHVGIKLALNSLYGKMAQQVGWERKEDGSIRKPPFHQLEYAGYATSYCRAAVLTAAISDLDSVIAFETDAIFTTRPLKVKIGTELGDFELTEFSDISYVQSGMWFGQEIGGKLITKTRGVDRGELTRENVITRMSQKYSEDRYAIATLTRFVGAGIALMQGMHKWRTWEKMTKRMVLEPTGKRIHLECDACKGDGITLGELHSTICPMFSKEHSCQFPIEWTNPDPNMTELAELRERGYDSDFE